MKEFNSKNIFKSVLVKFAVCFLLLGISYRLFSSSFVQFSPLAISDEDAVAVAEAPPQAAAEPPEFIDDLFEHFGHTFPYESCDLFNGDWIQDSDGPLYTTTTCKTIEAPQNCAKNGRPDSGYLYWRWKPKECSLPKLDAKRFLEMMRDKSLAFIGDSIMRNQVQSLLCVLSQPPSSSPAISSRPPSSSPISSRLCCHRRMWLRQWTWRRRGELVVEEAVETYHDEPYKNRRWSFPSHGFTVSVVWSPFLTKALTFEDDDGVSSGITQLHLDQPDPIWTDQYEDFDYVVISGGKWFLKPAIYYQNHTIWGCHICQDNNITEIGFEHAYQKALHTTLKFVSEAKHRPRIFLRTTTPDHFENGEWNTGGYCNRTRPFETGEVELRDIDEVMRNVEVEEFGEFSRKRGNLELLDTTRLSLLRPDGHPGVYRQLQPYAGKEKSVRIQNDCLHWCLPGPIDSWNDLMMEMLVRNQR